MASSSSSTTQVSFTAAELRHDSSRDEYESWKEAVVGFLESNSLVSYIDKDPPLPLEMSKDWTEIDKAVREWILGSVSAQLNRTVRAAKTAREVWLQLETNFPASPAPVPPTSPLQESKQMTLSLYKAVLRGDWGATEEILKQDPTLCEARVASSIGTALHIAVGTGTASPFLEKLVNHLPIHVLAVKSNRGRSALQEAALIGNLEAAKILVRKHRDLLFMTDSWGQLPVVIAAISGHRPTLEFFIQEAINDGFDANHYDAENCFFILHAAINMEFFDIALDMAERFPDLAKRKNATSGHSAIRALALKEDAFASGARLNRWERLVYDNLIPNPGEFGSQLLYQVIRRIVPRAKWIHEQKVKHQQALKLLKCLCSQMESLSETEAISIFVDVVLISAHFGIPEIIEAIVEIFPITVFSCNQKSNAYFIHKAVENRCEKVFNLVYQMSDHKYHISNVKDPSDNTLAHLVAKLAPPHKLNLVSGAALQMQRELQWFREVEKMVRPLDREQPNKDGKTPRMVFTEEHSKLKAEGERWMKDTANSCSIAAALIATVVFAAAITVPGGNAESGFPLFARSTAFIIFAVSDAISLFTSTTSLLMFLAILTSRYAEEDFLHALPKRLCVGLFTLFLSILSMMAAFSSTIYLVFGEKSGWVLIPVAVLACLPVTSFVLLQFPLLVDVVSSTYGRGIFGRQSDRPFH